MKAYKVVSIALYIFVVIVMISLGVRFISATEYFSYHAQAAGTEWSTIDAGLRLVYLAVFKVCGAAILSLCVCMLTMIVVPFAGSSQRWSYFAIPIVGMCFWSITLATTLHVTRTTPAEAPWTGSLACVLVILVAFAFSMAERSMASGKGILKSADG